MREDMLSYVAEHVFSSKGETRVSRECVANLQRLAQRLIPCDRITTRDGKYPSREGGPPMRAYSLDLRERVVPAVDQGYSRAEIRKLLSVSSATIKRYRHR